MARKCIRPYNGSMINNIKKRVFIIGIGGISMSAIARELVRFGHEVEGSDETESAVTHELMECGIKVYIGHKKSNIINVGTVIYSSAIGENNPELKMARAMGVDVLTRREALGLISKCYKSVVCVAGSHGKTTTTSLCAHFFKELGVDFCAHIGGVSLNFGTNYVEEKGVDHNLLLLEACEYKDNFLTLEPSVAAVLNISHDHVDYFKTEKDILNSFICFSNRVKVGGVLILNIDDKACCEVMRKTLKNKKVVTISLNNPKADYYLKLNKKTGNGFQISIFIGGNKILSYETHLKGEHNLYNLLFSVVITCETLGKQNVMEVVDKERSFLGVRRRYEKVGEINGAEVIFDYAHHPEEIDKVIKEAKEGLNGKLFVVFQPHTYSRTKGFWGEFIKSLKRADKLILFPIYKAREKSIPGVTSARMAKDLRGLGCSAYYAETLESIYNYLGYFVAREDRVLVLGAGDIDNLRKFFK